MLAVVDILGQQFKVEENKKYYVPLMKEEPESEISLDKVMLLIDENGTKIGKPYLNDVKVQAKVLNHIKDDKVWVFKKKRRTGYEKLNGHRQRLTQIEITKIG